MNFDITPNVCFGISKEKLFDICASSSFPGTGKWPPEHPIWDCNVFGKLSPRSAWTNEKCLIRAIDNLYQMLNRCVDGKHKKYPEFVNSHYQAFTNFDLSLLEKVLNRFTIAKIAPKVTALPESLFLRVIDESDLDISNGVYCPMAGFGGIVRACRKWLVKHNVSDVESKIYAADINRRLCDWYGWVCKDLLTETVKTEKTVCVCPPFGKKTERWSGTPENMYYTFEEWVKLIVSHILAPQYIFVGPCEVDRTGRESTCVGLFGRKMQARFYSKEEINNILNCTKEVEHE